MAQPVSEHRLAARAVALRTKIPLRTNDPHDPGRHELLEMVGLIDKTGALVEPTEDEKKSGKAISEVHGQYKTGKNSGQPGERLLADRSTLPVGLRNLPGQER